MTLILTVYQMPPYLCLVREKGEVIVLQLSLYIYAYTNIYKSCSKSFKPSVL